MNTDLLTRYAIRFSIASVNTNDTGNRYPNAATVFDILGGPTLQEYVQSLILAERERCAKIAHKYTRTFGGYSDSVERVAGDIEDEIRRGE